MTRRGLFQLLIAAPFAKLLRRPPQFTVPFEWTPFPRLVNDRMGVAIRGLFNPPGTPDYYGSVYDRARAQMGDTIHVTLPERYRYAGSLESATALDGDRGASPGASQQA